MSQVEALALDATVLRRSRFGWDRSARGRFVAGPKSFERLLLDPLVRDWIDGYTSVETREKKLYQFEKFLLASNIASAGELLRLSDREAKLRVRRLVNWYLQQGKGVWAKQVAITVKGFLESQDRGLEWKRSERVRTPPRKKVALEHVPAKSEVYGLAENSRSLRNRAVVLSLFQSGVRVSCLCNWTFGLLSEQLYPEIKVPVRINVTPNLDTKLSLYGLSYYVTGLREEAALAIREYLDSRRKNGWAPQASDPVFVTEDSGLPGRGMKRENVWLMVKGAARRSGLKPESVWTHCLRKSFRKVLNATPGIDEDTKEALMGHKLPGSRGSYFDYHDEDEVMGKYMQADFSRGVSFNYTLPK
jgi:integrase